MTREQALKFKNARKEKGMTQKQLADQLGISVSPIYFIENASGSVAIGTVTEVAAVLGLQIIVESAKDNVPRTESGKKSPETGKKKI